MKKNCVRLELKAQIQRLKDKNDNRKKIKQLKTRRLTSEATKPDHPEERLIKWNKDLLLELKGRYLKKK